MCIAKKFTIVSGAIFALRLFLENEVVANLDFFISSF